MKHQRKITVLLPEALIVKAMKETGVGLTPTLRKGLELVAAKSVYKELLKLKGKFDLKIDLKKLRDDS